MTYLSLEREDFSAFQESFRFMKQLLVTKSGTMILIASAVIENEQIDGAQTLFGEAKKKGKHQEEDRGVDDHSGYK